MPGTCWATRLEAFSTYGSSSPYDELPSRPEWSVRKTTSQPRARSRGTYFLACSTRPGKTIFPLTLSLSHRAMPGLVRPRMPTLMSGAPGTQIRLTVYGWKAGLSVFASRALAPSSGKRHWLSNFLSTSMP